MESILHDLTIVIVVAAGLSWLAMLTRQPVILAYIACGMLVAGLFRMDPAFLEGLSRLGVTLLLFLAGLALHPQRLMQLFRRTMPVTLAVCAASVVAAFGVAFAWGFGFGASAFIGLALMFSSTILVVKLLPTRTLHHDPMGAVCISVLVAQDLIAVLALLVIEVVGSARGGAQTAGRLVLMAAGGAGLVPAVILFEQHLLRRVLRQSHRYQETVYLVALAWCLGVGGVAWVLGFSYELGAFVAGVALARCPVARTLFEGLRVLRDFFLMLFFFALGARLDPAAALGVLLPAALIGALLLVLKPVAFHLMFRAVGEEPSFAREAGLRLGQASEFGLIIIALVTQRFDLVSPEVNELVVSATVLTMVVSSYAVVLRYPTPVGTRPRLQVD